MKKALIVFDSRSGSTEEIAELIAEGLRMEAVEVSLSKPQPLKKENQLQGFDAYIFGSPNYHGEMLQSLKMAQDSGREIGKKLAAAVV